MEFKIEKNEFLRGLYLAHGIADRKSTLPILANVLLRTEGKDRILCGATDLNVTTLASLSAKVEKEGGLTVAARQLYEIVKGLPTDEVRVRRTEQNWAEIRSGKVEFKVVGMPDRDYPKLPSIQEAELSNVDSATLREMIAQDDLLGVDRRDPAAPVGRALRVGRRRRADGVDRRAPAVQGRAVDAGRTEAGGGRADSAQGGHRAAARDRDARDAVRDRRVPGELRAQGGRREPVGEVDRRPVPALRPGDSQGQRPRGRRVASGVSGCAPARGDHVVGQDPGRAHRAREGQAAHRERQPGPRRGEGRDRRAVQGDARCRSASTRATSWSCSGRSRPPRFASSCRASWIRAWCGRPTAATTSASSCR